MTNTKKTETNEDLAKVKHELYLYHCAGGHTRAAMAGSYLISVGFRIEENPHAIFWPDGKPLVYNKAGNIDYRESEGEAVLKIGKINLAAYVGRRFLLKKTRFGALDGLIGTVKSVMKIPGADGEVERLEVETASSDFPRALMLPTQFETEVYPSAAVDRCVVCGPVSGPCDHSKKTSRRGGR